MVPTLRTVCLSFTEAFICSIRGILLVYGKCATEEGNSQEEREERDFPRYQSEACERHRAIARDS